MSLDEYMTKFTSEDNSSFQELHEKDHEHFLSKLQWMFHSNEKYNKLN